MSKNGYTVRADGRIQTSIFDKQTGKRIYFYGKTAKELKQKIFEYSQRSIAGPLFKDIAEAWWEEAEPNLALQSRRGYLAAKNKANPKAAPNRTNLQTRTSGRRTKSHTVVTMATM